MRTLKLPTYEIKKINKKTHKEIVRDKSITFNLKNQRKENEVRTQLLWKEVKNKENYKRKHKKKKLYIERIREDEKKEEKRKKNINNK